MSVISKVSRLVQYYEGMKVSRVAMCVVRSSEKTIKNKLKKESTVVSSEKK
jgi:hypothetical protein